VAESEEARDQDDYLENKRQRDKQLLDKMNASIVQEFGHDESKFNRYLNPNLRIYRRERRSRPQKIPPQPILLPRAYFSDLQPAPEREGYQD